MTERFELPAAVVERCADAVLDDLLERRGIRQTLEPIRDNDPDVWDDIRSAIGTAALVELLAIIEERGLRVVPAKATPEMVAAGNEARYYQHQDMHGVLAAMLVAAPPLAELLEDRADRS